MLHTTKKIRFYKKQWKPLKYPFSEPDRLQELIAVTPKQFPCHRHHPCSIRVAAPDLVGRRKYFVEFNYFGVSFPAYREPLCDSR